MLPTRMERTINGRQLHKRKAKRKKKKRSRSIRNRNNVNTTLHPQHTQQLNAAQKESRVLSITQGLRP
jgi:hypothetical protein